MEITLYSIQETLKINRGREFQTSFNRQPTSTDEKPEMLA